MNDLDGSSGAEERQAKAGNVLQSIESIHERSYAGVLE